MHIEQLTAKALVTKIEKLDAIVSDFCGKMIDAGRGYETFMDLRGKTDALSVSYLTAAESAAMLHQEKSRRLAYHGKLSPIRK